MREVEPAPLRPRSLAAALVASLCFSSGATAQSCDKDLYIGYYFEDAGANPEDPVPGSVQLLVPRSDGGFSGEMYFTYVGCQSRNVGTVTGVRSGATLRGTWQGMVDNTAQTGTFDGRADARGEYSGDYTVDAGKQKIVVDGCAEYYIAPFGRWSLVPALEDRADDERISVERTRVQWTQAPGAAFAACQLLELDESNCNEATTATWQQVTAASAGFIDMPSNLLRDGQRYAAACAQADASGNVLAFSKRRFDFPASGVIEPPVTPPPATDSNGRLIPLIDLLLND